MKDLDNDGDLDLVSTSSGAINVWWFENIDGAGNFGLKQEIEGNGSAVRHTLITDFDGDDFIDVLAVYGALDRLVWHKNLNGTGNFSNQINISLSDNAIGINTGDIDHDGDIDILSASSASPNLKWYENEDGLGAFSSEKIIETDYVDTKCLLVDIDNDGDLDALRSSQNDDTIVWYENLTILSTEDAQLNTIEVHPNPAVTALYVTGNNISEISYMSMTNILGTTVWKSKVIKNTIDSSAWSSGRYFLKLKNSASQKRVIQIIKK